MKIDHSKLKKGNFDVPLECKALIARIRNCKGKLELLNELKSVKSWVYGKCELLNWVDILDKMDEVLEAACQPSFPNSADGVPVCPWPMACDLHCLQESNLDRELLLAVLHFSALLIEHSFTRHLYSSMEHLTTLLASSDMTVVLAVVDVLYVFSKRSNFISRLPTDKKQALIHRLVLLAESWGGRENGFGLAACAQDLPPSSFPETATTLHFEFYDEADDMFSKKASCFHQLRQIHVPRLDEHGKDAASLMVSFLKNSKPPKDKEMQLFTHIRLALSFSDYEKRLQCVQARLQAISTLIYSNAAQDYLGSLLYSGFVEELVDLLELKSDRLTDLKATSLRTLTAVVHFEGNRKLNSIIDATGTSSYHGFLPTLMRQCIQNIIDPENPSFPQSLTTALFSFLYHLASYESGGEALISCGIMESLIKVISWHGDDSQDHITFVTRAVRVVDLVMSLDMQSFQSYGAMNEFINRLQHEVDICKKEHPFVFHPRSPVEFPEASGYSPRLNSSSEWTSMETDRPDGHGQAASEADRRPGTSASQDSARQCFPQRVALLKSILNFIKKAISETSFSDTTRHLMDGSLPCSLKHIISNAEYYGASLFLLATELVTVYVFQEPSMLSSLQSNGLTDIMLQALLVKNVPATKEVLSALPNVFSALCLNSRGLDAFMACNPFENLFKVLLSPDYLPAMKRRRSSDLPGDTATSLGSAVDELMRHQPSLKSEAINGIISLLADVRYLGRDPSVVCHQRPTIHSAAASPGSNAATNSSAVAPQGGQSGQSNNNLGNSSDDDDDDDDVASVHSVAAGVATATTEGSSEGRALSGSKSLPGIKVEDDLGRDKRAVPLVDYVLNVMKFIEAILSNNTTDDHCREFVSQKGLAPLLDILVLPNLPSDFPSSTSCQAVAGVCKSILTLTHDPQVLVNALQVVNGLLNNVRQINTFLDPPGASVLLREMTDALVNGYPDPALDPKATPLLHSLKAIHSVVMVFIAICKANQNDIRSLSLNQWGSALGFEVLKGLSKLYQSLVWESSVMVNLCSETCILHQPTQGDNSTEAKKDEIFGMYDLKRIMDHLSRADRSQATSNDGGSPVPMDLSAESGDVATEMEVEVTAVLTVENSGGSVATSQACRYCQTRTQLIKSMLLVASKLGRSLTELFVLLVRVSVGSPVRPRRNQQNYQSASIMVAPLPVGRAVALHFAQLMNNSLRWFPPGHSPVWKRRVTYLLCSIAFTSSMMFDDKKQPYHLMLQKFISQGCHRSLYAALRWVMTKGDKMTEEEVRLSGTDFPDGSVEFVDVWLMLVEKLVNPKNILESPYNMPAASSQPGYKAYDPIQYLTQMQMMAFQALSLIWEKSFVTVRMAESALNILCHIINCENVFKKKKKTPGDSSVPVAENTSTTVNNPTNVGDSVLSNSIEEQVSFRSNEESVNVNHLQQLMDMGFSRAQAVEALLNSNGLEQATEYCLFHPPPVEGTEANEDDQMVQAIAMSLNDNEQQETPSAPQLAETSTSLQLQPGTNEDDSSFPGPVLKEMVDEFIKTILRKCMSSIDEHPDVVFKITEVFALISERNGSAWLDQMLDTVVMKVKSLCDFFIEKSQPMTIGDKRTVLEWANGLSEVPQAPRLAARLHFLSLLFEIQKVACTKLMERSGLLELLVRLMHSTHHCIGISKGSNTPKWVAPMMLLVDLYEKMAISTKRRMQLVGMIGTSHVWKWFDDRSGRWSSYGPGNNKTIDEAYWMGQTSVRFTAGRRRYLVQFNTMIQVNEETGNRRPIMLNIPTKDDQPTIEAASSAAEAEDKLLLSVANKQGMSTTDNRSSINETDDVINGLTPEQGVSLIRSCVGFIGAKVDPDTLHACLRLTLRLTRDLDFSQIFVEMNGPKLLLSLSLHSSFQGFFSLATLILRHTIEDEKALTYAMEKIIRSSTLGTGSSACGVAMNSNGSRELHYVMRVLSPAICRDKEIFRKVAKKVLRIQLPVIKKDEEEARVLNPSNPQLVKCNFPDPRHKMPPLGDLAKEVIHVMLRTLATSNSAATDAKQTPASESRPVTKDGQTNNGEERMKRLIPKSGIMRLLAELVRSYVGCASFIASQSYKADDADLVVEDCTVLSFILDHLMHRDVQDNSDLHLPTLSRLLLASIAASNHSPDAQNILAVELKNALQRALAMPECADKHSRIQSIAQLIATVIQACPVYTQKISLLDSQVYKSQAPSNLNHMVRVLIKRGIVSDLARVPHSLDLSSPYMAATVNATLKPLETLSRIVNQPQMSGATNAGQKVRHQLLTPQEQVRSFLNPLNAGDAAAVAGRNQGDEGQGGVARTAAEPGVESEARTGVSALREAYGDVDEEEEEDNNIDAMVDAAAVGGQEVEHPVDDLIMADDVERGDFFEDANDIDLEDDDSTDIDDEMVDEEEDEDDEDAGGRGNDDDDDDDDDRSNRRQQSQTLDAVLDTLLDRETGGDPDVIGDIITMSVERPGEAEDTVEIDIEVGTTGNRDAQVVIQRMSDNEDDEEVDEENPANNQEDDHDNEQWEGELDEDGEDDDNEDDDDGDEDDDDDVDDDDDERSVVDGDDDDFADEAEVAQRNNDYDELLSQWEDLLPSSSVLVDGSGPMRGYLPISVQGADSAADAGTSLPPVPSGVMTSHPLLVRSQDGTHRDPSGSQGNNNTGTSAVGGSRLHRTSRSRNTFRYNPNTQTLHVQYTRSRHVNPPAILQRLLGASSDVMHLSHSLTTGGSTRLQHLSNDELRVVTRAGGGDESLLESLFQGDLLNDEDSSSLGLLTDIPAALSRWAEEAKVLDGEIGMFETMSVVKRDVLAELEHIREAQVVEMREKRAKEKQSSGNNNNNTAEEVKSFAPGQSKEDKTGGVNTADKDDPQNVDDLLPAISDQENEQAQQQLQMDNTAEVSNNSAVDLPTLQSVLTELNDLTVVRNTDDPLNLRAELMALTSGTTFDPELHSFSRIPDNSLPALSDSETRPSLDGNTRILVTFAEDLPPTPLQASGSPPGNLSRDADNSSSLSEPMSGVTISRDVPLEMNHLTGSVELGSSLPGDAAGGGVTVGGTSQAVGVSDRASSGISTTSASGNEMVATPSAPQPSTSSGEPSGTNNMFGDVLLPEGVDPSFLAALPENIRQEVIAEQLRLQRIQQRVQQQQIEAQSLGISEVSPEFLAALPSNIQEEVLAQQRVEQSRLTQNPETPTDPASFIQSLPASLRQQVLADMDDSMLAVLPPDLAAEANVLRRELEDRHRMLLQERLFTQGGVLSGILRHPGYSSRNLQGNSYSLRPSNTMTMRSSHWNWSHATSGHREGRGTSSGMSQAVMAAAKVRGRHLLDNEALTCLLVLLFVDESRLNTTRLHRVVRNLSYHAPTRSWIVNSLLSVLSRTNEQLRSDDFDSKDKCARKKISLSDVSNESWTPQQGEESSSSDLPAWLNIYLCAALGSQTNVFRISRPAHRHHSSKTHSGPGTITIHPQACPIICKHVLDILISLAKTFPTHFLPQQSTLSPSDDQLPVHAESPSKGKQPKDGPPTQAASSPGCSGGATPAGKPDFWDSLVKLDSALGGRKGKSSQKEKFPVVTTQDGVASCCGSSQATTFESSPLGQLMSMLSHPVVRRSQMLTDRLLRVLKLISVGLFDNFAKPLATSVPSSSTTSTNNNVAADDAPIATPTAAVASDESKQSLGNEGASSSFSFCIDLEKSTVLENQLKLLVEILISKHCSEEGFEDATSLLLQLAKSDSFLCEIILKLLVKGAHQLGCTVCSHIRKLSDELNSMVLVDVSPKEEEDASSMLAGPSNQKGILQDRFVGGKIIVYAPSSSKFKGRGRELQLPSMQLLTNKGSSQNYLLRVLKIIILLRGPMKSIIKKNQNQQASNAGNPQDEEQNETASVPMEVEGPGGSLATPAPNSWPNMPHMTEFIHLDELWNTLGECLLKLAKMPDNHAVLVLQQAVEAFFFVHAGKRDQSKKENNQTRREDQLAHVAQHNPSMSPNTQQLDQPKLNTPGQPKTCAAIRPETQKFIGFAETHRTVLNQILRQSTVPLADGPFSVLVDYTRVLDFDVKRRYFRQELDRMDEGLRKEDLAVHVRRDNVFEDSFRELHRRTPEEWKNRFYIVFEGEEGQDAGGLLREWYIIISREIFNPNYALFCTSPGDRVTYTINTSSHCNSNHLSYFKFVGRIIATAIYDNKLLECYFTRSFYKHILGVPVKYTDMESEDYDFYKGLVFLLENNVEDLGYDLTFSTEIQEFGVTTIRDLKEEGRDVRVTEENKKEYVKLVCQMKMTGAIKQQLTAFLDGFYSIIPKRLISIFNEQELELLISGLPSIDIDDLKANTEIHKYQANALQVQWFWRALRSFDQADRARFLQFVTGTSKVPLQGFAYLEGMNGIQKFQIHKDDRSTDRLPSAHTCFNQLDLPIYETFDKLKHMLLLAIHECSEGFGLA